MVENHSLIVNMFSSGARFPKKIGKTQLWISLAAYKF